MSDTILKLKTPGSNSQTVKPKNTQFVVHTADMDGNKVINERKIYDKSEKRYAVVAEVFEGPNKGSTAVTLPNGRLIYISQKEGDVAKIKMMIADPKSSIYVVSQKRITDTPAPVIKGRTFIKVGKDTFLSYAGFKKDGQIHQVLVGITKNGIFYMKDANDKITLMPKASSDTEARQMAIAAMKREHSSIVAIITDQLIKSKKA